MTTPSTPPTYRDHELGALLKGLRADVKPLPSASLTLQRVEKRLRYVLRVIESWDAYHAERAETLIKLGKFEAANSTATMIFDEDVRAALYWRAPVTLDTGAGERIAEALELEREILV